MSEGIPYHVSLATMAGAGDYVCLMSACREFTRRTGNPVNLDIMPDVIAAYRDPNLRYGSDGVKFMLSPNEAHREKEPGDYMNYYGTFLGAMGLLRKGDDPKLDLPIFDKMESYVILQPFSVYAQNPKLEYLQILVNNFLELTGVEVHIVGKESTPRILQNVKYDLLQDSITSLMKIVQNSALVLGPRSLLSHLAAGYNRPAFIWVPDDNENWHLDYSGWERILHPYSQGTIAGIENLKVFLKRQGMI